MGNNKIKYVTADKKFVNPYHFIPLENGCKRRSYNELREQDDLLTGWIECELETLTPIFIPNTNNDDFYKLKDSKGNKVCSYDFYSYQDNSKSSEETKLPIIGGSSIRGTIRSTFEAITNSCLSTTSGNFVLYKRTTKPAENLGRLELRDGSWFIKKCNKYKIPKSKFDKQIDTIDEKQEVFFTFKVDKKKKIFAPEVTAISTEDEQGDKWKRGYIHHGEAFGKTKKYETLFQPTTDEISLDSDLPVSNLLDSFKLYQDETVNLHLKKGEHDGYKKALPNAEYRDVDELNNALIYYTEYQGNYYLSPAAVGREVFNNKLKKLLGSYSPCSNREELCPACSLFGFVNGEEQIASRVRFSDAKPTVFNFLEPVIIPELSGPKVSATEMYFIGSDEYDLWNADYTVPNDRDYEAKIHGRKFYWHHDPSQILKQDVETPSQRNVKIRPLAKESKFNFKIHFNNISETELKQLLWTLTLGENRELAHKIGMAKPLGLGSIRIDVRNIQLRKLSLNGPKFYDISDYNVNIVDYRDQINPHTLKALELLFNYEKQQKNIRYPYAVGSNGFPLAENYHWFVGNKQLDGKGTGTDPKITQRLRPLTENKIRLDVIMNLDENGKSNGEEQVFLKKKESIKIDPNVFKIEKLIDIKDYEVYFTRFRELSAELNPDKYQNKLNEQITKKVTQLSEDIRSDKNINNLINTLEMVIKYKDCFTNNLAEMIAGAVRKRNDFEPKTIYSPKPKYRGTYDKLVKELKLN